MAKRASRMMFSSRAAKDKIRMNQGGWEDNSQERAQAIGAEWEIALVALIPVDRKEA